jgi:tetratricopeptide (TPR) repeat protein
MDAMAEQLIERLRRNPDDADAFAALRAHYHHRGDFASLTNLLEGWAQRCPDGRAASSAFREAADLCAAYLNDRERTIALYERAVEHNPLAMEASNRLEELYEESGDGRRLLDLLERRVEALAAADADPRHVAATHHAIAEVWAHRLRRVDRAVSHYRKAFELDPSLVQAIYAAREIYRHAGNTKAAAALYELEANAEPNPDRRVALWRELAHLRNGELGDTEGAIAAIRRALGIAPADLGAQHDLATMLLGRAERGPDAESAATDRRAAADLMVQMARAVGVDHAIEYAGSALDAVPSHDGALQLLEEVARRAGREDLLPPRWVQYVHHAPHGSHASEARRRLGAAYVDAGQIDDAIACLEPLLEEGDARAAETLADLFRASDRHEDVARALAVAVGGLPPEQRLPRLREMIVALDAEGRSDESFLRTRELLEIEPADEAALARLEESCRARGDYGTLRDHLLAAARVPGLSVEARKGHLLGVAGLSEEELEDPAGAASAWRAIAALDPGDRRARTELDRLLETTERWDDLAALLEREALSVTSPDDKVAIYCRLARIHRDRRGRPDEAIATLRSVVELKPDDVGIQSELCDALIAAGAYLEAVPLLRARIEAAAAGPAKVADLRRLGTILEEQLDDEDGAFEAMTRLLDQEPGDRDAIAGMERIDRRSERWERLLETLSYRVEVTPATDRASAFAEMGQVAEEGVKDLDRAAEYYAQALDLDPQDTTTLDRLCRVYDRAERYRDLVVLLKDRSSSEKDPRARAELYRRIARTLAHRVRNENAASEAWLEVLVPGDDEEALRYLLDLAKKREAWTEAEALLARLVAVTTDPTERRVLVIERAQLLGDELDRTGDAISSLTELLADPDDVYPPALSLLTVLTERAEDWPALAMTLERQLAHTVDGGLRLPLARRLADLYEGPLPDSTRAIAALYAWADCDGDLTPRERLVPQLERTGRWAELVAVIDTLVEARSGPEAYALARRASSIAERELKTEEGAWQRLLPGFLAGDDESIAELHRLATETGRGEELADVVLASTQNADTAEERKQGWLRGARIFEELVDDTGRALEAMLRAFAEDLDDQHVMAEVDRLAGASAAWDRLGQVYEALVRKAGDDATKSRLLFRHASVLDQHGGDLDAALDEVLRACALDVQDTYVENAEALSVRAGRADELLVVYDRLRGRAHDEAAQLDALLRSMKLADGALDDRERAFSYLRQAVTLAASSPELADRVEAHVVELDRARPELGSHAAARALVDIYRAEADRDAEDEPARAAALLLRGARLLADAVGDGGGAFDELRDAANLAPSNTAILDTFELVAEREGRVSELEQHLAALLADALDQATAIALLRRRGRLLSEQLDEPDAASEAWARVVALRPDDAEAFDGLIAALRAAGEHQQLLTALERQLDRTPEADRRVTLLREIAGIWEREVGNKWEAIDSWKRVLALDPDDEDANEAIERLGHSTRRLSAAEVASMGAMHPQSAALADVPSEPIPGTASAEQTGEYTDPGFESPEDDPFGEHSYGGSRSTEDAAPKPGAPASWLADDDDWDDGTAQVSPDDPFEDAHERLGHAALGIDRTGRPARRGQAAESVLDPFEQPPFEQPPFVASPFERGPSGPRTEATNELSVDDLEPLPGAVAPHGAFRDAAVSPVPFGDRDDDGDDDHDAGNDESRDDLRFDELFDRTPLEPSRAFGEAERSVGPSQPSGPIANVEMFDSLESAVVAAAETTGEIDERDLVEASDHGFEVEPFEASEEDSANDRVDVRPVGDVEELDELDLLDDDVNDDLEEELDDDLDDEDGDTFETRAASSVPPPLPKR